VWLTNGPARGQFCFARSQTMIAYRIVALPRNSFSPFYAQIGRVDADFLQDAVSGWTSVGCKPALHTSKR
jgi:hypothetical protein